MPKLPALTSKRVIKIIKKIGFQLVHTTGSHFIFKHQGTKQIAVVPYHAKDLPKGTLLEIIKQAGISKEDLFKLLH